jgi:hypothetical protein
MTAIRIRVEEAGIELGAQLNDSETAARVLAALPLEGSAQTWGDEVYFTVPVEAAEEDPHATVTHGTIGYWPPGNAVCLFFGQQPVSPVNVIGMVEGDAGELAAVRDGQVVRLEALASGS